MKDKGINRISDFMFRFWYKYVFNNRSLLETGAAEIVYNRRILPDYSQYMGLVFERICKEFMERENVSGKLPILFSSIGRWWGTDAKKKKEVEIDLIAQDGKNYLIGECKWQNEKVDCGILNDLKEKGEAFNKKREKTWFVLFSKSGFTKSIDTAAQDPYVLLYDMQNIFE